MKSVLMIIGMSTRKEVFQILGKDSQNLFYWKKNLQRDICGPRETDKKSSDHWTRQCVAWSMDQNWWSRSEEREARMDKREVETRWWSTIEWHSIDVEGEEKFGSAHGRGNAVQQGDWRSRLLSGNWSEARRTHQFPKTKYAWVVEAHESTRQRLESSLPQSHEDHIADKGHNSITSLCFCRRQKKSGCKSSSGQGMEEARNETIPAWKLDKVRSKKEVILEAQKDKKKVHFVSLMDTCHLKIAELEPQFQKYNGRVVLRGDIVKDDSGAYAVFTEQGSSASQMTASKSHGYHIQTARMLRTSSGRSICLYPGKNDGCSQNCSKFQSQNVQIYGYVFHDTNGPNHERWRSSGSSLTKFVRIPAGGSLLWKAVRASSVGTEIGKRTEIGKCLLVHRTTRSILIEIRGTTSKWVERSRKWRPSGRKVMKNVDLDERSRVFGVYSTWMQIEWNYCWATQISVWIKYFCWSNWKITRAGKIHAKTAAWSNDMEGHAQKCVEKCCELANKKTKQLCKVSSPCLDVQIKKEELESIGELSQVCTQIVLTCLELARIGRSDILWSVDNLAWSVTEWKQD